LTAKDQTQFGSTQDILQFAEIRDGIIITKTGELRMVLMVSSINFALKSEQEQNAIIFAYQNFLNSLTFPIQILMRSQQLDLSNYLSKLKQLADMQVNELLRIQTLDYTDFITKLISMANIMDKKFYVVVAYTPPAKIQGANGLFSNMFGNKAAGPVQFTTTEFAQYAKELEQRLQVTQSGLNSIGIRAASLNTQQIIELLYSIYNPREAAKQKLVGVDQLSAETVESEIEK